jgi:hypothetical protein
LGPITFGEGVSAMTTTVTTYQAERDRTLSVIGSGVALRDETCGGSAESMGRIATLVPHGERRVRHRDGGDHHLRQQGSPAITGVNDPRMRFCANDGPATPRYEVSNCTKPVVPKCISRRNATGVGDLVITVLMTWKDPTGTGSSR